MRKFVIINGQITGTLVSGLTFDGAIQKEFVMRDSTVGDLLDAEIEADVIKTFNFSAQLLTRQLASIGTFKGPFTMNMIRKLKKADLNILRSAQRELDALGEDESPVSETS
jgi:phage FluMu protein gp41